MLGRASVLPMMQELLRIQIDARGFQPASGFCVTPALRAFAFRAVL